jgi:uncharacterized protein YdhG (YjbR/CyaY superfamily)
MTPDTQASPIDAYIAGFPEDTQALLQQVRRTIAQVAPGAVETLSYAIPTFDLNGKHLVHFAGFQNHIGFYPTPSGIVAFAEEFSAYKGAKGSVQFPLSKPIPFDLIRRVTEYRVGELS